MKHNINSQNTKTMLAETLLSLLEKKPISKITVSEIVELCEINRKTFYYHFADVYDLFEWHIQQELQRAISLMEPLSDINATTTYAIEYMKSNSYLRNCISNPISRDKIVQILNNALTPKIREMMQELEESYNKTLDAEFKAFLIKTISRITVLSIIDAIENPYEYELEHLQRYMSDTIYASIHSIFPEK